MNTVNDEARNAQTRSADSISLTKLGGFFSFWRKSKTEDWKIFIVLERVLLYLLSGNSKRI